MIFSIEPETRRFVAHLVEGGEPEVYDCTASACGNPVCRCRTTTVEMHPRSTAKAPRKVGIDLDGRAIDASFRKRALPDDLAFSEKILADMDGADFDLIGRLHFTLKNRICETAKPSEIEANFSFEEVEASSTLQAYNDVLPFGDMFRVTVEGAEYVVLDQYCVKPGCRCTDAHLMLLPAEDADTAGESSGRFMVGYDDGNWEVVEGERAPCDVTEFQRVFESTNSNLYKTLQLRHKKMRAIYAHSRRRELEAREAVLSAGPIRRNDVCPCGSGKKYKKCCIDKAAQPLA